MTRRVWPWVLVALHLALVFHLSSIPNPLPEVTSRIWDKGLHLVEYAVLGALLLFALRSSGVDGGRAFLLAVGGASLYGVSDEFHQSFVPGRSSEGVDWLADSLGGLMGAALMAGFLRLVGANASIRGPPGRG